MIIIKYSYVRSNILLFVESLNPLKLDLKVLFELVLLLFFVFSKCIVYFYILCYFIYVLGF
jgi:hypothetical protein